jgi:hypothetical protein
VQSSSFAKNVFDVPQEIQCIADEERLGDLCKIYNIAKGNTTICLTGKLCIFFGIFMTFFDLMLYSETFFDHLIYTILAFTLLMIGLYTTLSRRIYAHWHIYLWQYGFIYEKKQIRQAFRWNQIESIQADVAHIHNSIIYTCKVRHRSGYEVKLGNVFLEISELIDILLIESAHQFAAQELIIAPSKGIKTFINIKLDRQGIGNEQETLPWHEIREFLVKEGTIMLFKKEGE